MNKRLILAGVVVVFSILFWWVTKESVNNIQLREPGFWIKNIFVLGLYAGFLANFLIASEIPGGKKFSRLNFSEEKFRRASATRLILLIFVIQAILYVLFFYQGQGFRFYTLGALIFVLSGLAYFKTLDREKHESIKISFPRIVNKNLGLLILSLSLLLSIGYFFSPKVQERSKKFEVPLTYRNLILSLSQEILLRSAPQEVKEQLQNPAVKRRIESEVERSSSQTLGVLEDSLKPYLKFMPIFLTIGFFLTLAAFTFLWKWMILLFGGIIFIILKKTGVISIKKVVIEKEEITI